MQLMNQSDFFTRINAPGHQYSKIHRNSLVGTNIKECWQCVLTNSILVSNVKQKKSCLKVKGKQISGKAKLRLQCDMQAYKQ
jgi:hypothetical protein